MALPEYLQSKKISSGRISSSQRKKVYSEILNQINQIIGTDKTVQYGNAFYFNKNMSKEEREVATKIIKKAVRSIEGVSQAFSIEDILNLSPYKLNNRLKNMIHPQKGPDVYVLFIENWLWKRSYGSSHGSHYDYDSQVPLIISKNKVVYPTNLFPVLNAFVAPILPEPISLISFFKKIFVKIKPNGIDPIRYDAIPTIKYSITIF